MAYEKGDRVEPGIWKLAAKTKAGDQYVAEVSFQDPETTKRARRWKTFTRLELAQQWRRKQDDDVRRQMGGEEGREGGGKGVRTIGSIIRRIIAPLVSRGTSGVAVFQCDDVLPWIWNSVG